MDEREGIEKADKFALQKAAEKYSISIEEADRLFRKEATSEIVIFFEEVISCILDKYLSGKGSHC